MSTVSRQTLLSHHMPESTGQGSANGRNRTWNKFNELWTPSLKWCRLEWDRIYQEKIIDIDGKHCFRKLFYSNFFNFWSCHEMCGILAPQPGTEPFLHSPPHSGNSIPTTGPLAKSWFRKLLFHICMKVLDSKYGSFFLLWVLTKKFKHWLVKLKNWNYFCQYIQ